MNAKKIELNDRIVHCYDDGSVSIPNNLTGAVVNTKGCNNRGYRQVRVGESRHQVHRLIARAFLGDYSSQIGVDHINGDRADNRPENLRMATPSQNSRGFNRPSKGAVSKYRGVSKHKSGKWIAQILGTGVVCCNYAGIYSSEIDAAKAYDSIAIVGGYLPEALNFSVREAQNLLLCVVFVDKINKIHANIA